MNPRQDPSDPIKHVILLMLENHSFDQMLGAFKELYPGLEGVDPTRPGVNRDAAGQEYRQLPTTERQMVLDPHHEVRHVARQLDGDNGGFVADLQESFGASSTSEQLAQQSAYVMGYYPRGFLPALHTLAGHFTICDHWFSSLPGPTWPNRFFALTGTSNGRVNMPDDGEHKVDLAGWFEQNQDTIFDRLTEVGVSWKVYYDSIPQTCVLTHQRLPRNAARYFPMDEFYTDARGREEDFPPFCLIEPDYLGAHENDDHPPHDVMKAQKLLADVYNALRANPALWESTLLVVLYDEHGGFYDHVPPPKAEPPDHHKEEYTFDRLGVRVPALLVSPRVGRRFDATVFDHTSLLRYLIDKWRLRPLGNRTAKANSIAPLIDHAGPARQDTPSRIELDADHLQPPDPQVEENAEAYVSGHHKSLAHVFEYLKLEALEAAPEVYSGFGRLVEAFVHGIFGSHPSKLADATKVDSLEQHQAVKEHFSHYFRQQRRKAIPILAGVIRDERQNPGVRHDAVETLGHIARQRLHREADPVAAAERWLADRGH